MPMVPINSKAGPANVSYTISTPTCTSAEKIDPGIPTYAQHMRLYILLIVLAQFCDPKLRRFNLIGVDTRLHGDTEGEVKGVWRSENAADDMAAFMPAEVRDGRHEIYEYWCQGWSDPTRPDKEAIKDSANGSNQLGFNSTSGPLIKAFRKVTIPRAVKNYGPGRFEECYMATVGFFEEQVDYSAEKLRRIWCPVKLVHCGGDIAYPIYHSDELLQRLVDAGVDAKLEVVEDAPHFGTVTYATEINSLLHDFLMKQTMSDVPVPEEVTSPFEAMLVAAGWSPDHINESFEEEDLFSDLASLVLNDK
ncbi:hypothetical protein C0995_000531 [Termitomyces sp. Mi166|nr:hypothetical protein C0995_000531 [Termitomyces sp. Mi166\